MKGLTRYGADYDLYYFLYDWNNQHVGDIDKRMLIGPDIDPDASVFVTLPCGYEARFFRHDFTDEQYIDAANRLKQLDNETK